MEIFNQPIKISFVMIHGSLDTSRSSCDLELSTTDAVSSKHRMDYERSFRAAAWLFAWWSFTGWWKKQWNSVIMTIFSEIRKSAYLRFAIVPCVEVIPKNRLEQECWYQDRKWFHNAAPSWTVSYAYKHDSLCSFECKLWFECLSVLLLKHFLGYALNNLIHEHVHRDIRCL